MVTPGTSPPPGRIVTTMLVALALLSACGGGSPSAAPSIPTPSVSMPAPPTPAPTPEPTPVPSPPPTPCDTCEETVTNDSPAARLSIRLYILTDEHGQLVRDYDTEAIPVGWRLTLDATAKDAQNRETNGQKVVRWFVDDESIVQLGGSHLHQLKVTPRGPGRIEVYARQDGVDSNTLKFRFVK
jgi:hypothetical protein